MKLILGSCLAAILIASVVCPYTEADCKTKAAFSAKATQLTTAITGAQQQLDTVMAQKAQLPAQYQTALTKLQTDLKTFKTNKESLNSKVQSGKIDLPTACQQALTMVEQLKTDLQAVTQAAG
ncbi:unnamed protein product [Oppiella nova]|uniref:Uncharacterized protein n=1 Tax=Oppiella nova TaxID=334625 RepID=A0A7R9QWK0_9ACAR|nr:unnamed protein product [Oppiella nova]CAG2177013.1 unnamed protein product [Oppiella nova]